MVGPRPGASADAALIKVRNLGKTYWLDERALERVLRIAGVSHGGGYRLQALNDVSFDLHAGEAVGVLGRNGSGKSTLLGILTGTLVPTSGSVERRGKVASLLELGVGFHPERTGRENALVATAMSGLPRERGESLLDEIAAFADIGQFFDMPVKTYSTGMFVRLAFAAQSVLEPDLWIIDEALSVGDFAFQQRALAWLRRFLDGGGALLLATHDTAMVDSFCTRALVLDGGELVHDGPLPAASQLYISRYSQPGVLGTDADWPGVPVETTATLDLGAFLSVARPRPPQSQYLGRRIELLGVTIEDALGQPANAFRSGEVMRVRAAFRVHEYRPHVTVTVILHDEAGPMIWSAGVVNSRQLLRVESGRAYICTTDVVLDLQPGRYPLSVGLATANLETNARTAEFHDRFAHLATIEVIGDAPAGRGVARLPWSRVPVRQLDQAERHPDEIAGRAG